MSTRVRRDKAARRRRGQLAVVRTFPPPTPPWTPVTMLEEFIGDLRTGKEQARKGMMIFWFEETSDGGTLPRMWTTGVTQPEQLAFMELGKAMVIREWRKEAEDP